jgi:hypothetical protein
VSDQQMPVAEPKTQGDEPNWIAQRHGVADAEPVVSKMTHLLSAITTTAAGHQ